MFETAELGRKLSDKAFKKTAPQLREELLELQDSLRRTGRFQVILLFSGVDGGGKGETVSLLNGWMDPRWLVTRAYDEPSEGELNRPEFWKFWRDLPPRGSIGMFLSAWYSRPVLDRVYGDNDEAIFLKRLDRIVRFERALVRDGALILKFWMHLSHAAQERRLKSLELDPLTKARVTPRDWEHWNLYDRFIETGEQVITRTNRGLAPWTIVEGEDANYRAANVATILRDALTRRMQEGEGPEDRLAAIGKKPPKSKDKQKATGARKANGMESQGAKALTVLSHLDMSKRISKARYRKEIVEHQARLHRLHLKAKVKKMSSILVFEGPDAAGKGGAIRRINAALDARNYQVYGIAAPTDEERAQHYLWRFWRRLPRAGHIAIYDRSWYGRVLVERVEGFANEDEWRRSYAEINDFEDQLIEQGIVLVKFWVHITKEEQLNRFKLREKTPYKRWKITEEDWRNREKWEDYEEAVNDMVQYTSSSIAPWVLIEGNDKRFARIKVIKTYCGCLAKALGERVE